MKSIKTNQILDDFTFENSSKIAEVLMRAFKDNKFDEIRLIYNQFKTQQHKLFKTRNSYPS
ncbi:hypothetical protein [Ornithobacterium rhinotracheale]|uniref:hypothetical protein n=1 Tax=Ornithobacterium rhinotracheale TaxID=28251 RepID=UPI00374CCF3E